MKFVKASVFCASIWASSGLYAAGVESLTGGSGDSDEEQAPEHSELIQPGELPGLSMDGSDSFEYRIGIRDLLEIEVFQVTDLGHSARVNSQGYISLPLIGGVKVEGLTIEEVERLLEQKLGEDYLQDPHVTVFIKEYESQKVTIEGWVKDPGIFPLSGKTTLLQAIALADGMDRLADQEEVVIFRKVDEGKIKGYKVDITKIRAGAMRDPLIQKNDVIVVPKHGGKGLLDDVTRTMRGFIGFGTF